jgi:hypothetical protein
MRLLSVDFDYFFPMPHGKAEGETVQEMFLYDWGHREAPFFAEMIWSIRKDAFDGRGVPLPMTSGWEERFWPRFTFAPKAKFYLADSHLDIIREPVIRDITEIWNFDAHHDCGYNGEEDNYIFRGGPYDCGNWGVYAHFARNIRLYQRYPYWHRSYVTRDKPPIWITHVGKEFPAADLVFDRVFLCRSSAWVPPWVDDRFEKFRRACPLRLTSHRTGPSDPMKRRKIVEIDFGKAVEEDQFESTSREKADGADAILAGDTGHERRDSVRSLESHAAG